MHRFQDERRSELGDPVEIGRRSALTRLAGMAAFGLATPRVFADEPPPRTELGLVLYNHAIRRKWLAQQSPAVDLFEPLTFLKHCRSLGTAGMQASLGVLDRDRIRDLRSFSEQHGLFIEAIVTPPQNDGDQGRFEAEVRTAAEVGALAARTVIIPGRRYERFKSLAEFREFESRGREMLERAAPIVTRHRVKLAVENHKDQRIDERLDLYRRLECEYIGACVDTGNSFALLDDPYGAIEALAPYAFSVHFKDQTLRETDDGFLLGDIPLGQGSFDLKRMADILRKAPGKPRFVLELITREPLRVPCLTDAYWAPMGAVPANDLARTLRFVRQHPGSAPPAVDGLPLERQVALEDAQVAASLKYAREELGG